MAKADTASTLVSALAAAQVELKNPVFDRENGAFRNGGKVSKYASLAAHLDAIRPVLAKHGIAVTQSVFGVGGVLGVGTHLYFGDESRSTTIEVPLPTTAHALVGMTTYLRRCQLAAMVGVVGDDDHDGNDVVEPVKAPARPEPTAQEMSSRLEAIRAKQNIEKAVSGKLPMPAPAKGLTRLNGCVAKVETRQTSKGDVYKVYLETGEMLTAWPNLEGVGILSPGYYGEFNCTVKDGGKYGPEYTIKDFTEVLQGEEIPF